MICASRIFNNKGLAEFYTGCLKKSQYCLNVNGISGSEVLSKQGWYAKAQENKHDRATLEILYLLACV